VFQDYFWLISFESRWLFYLEYEN